MPAQKSVSKPALQTPFFLGTGGTLCTRAHLSCKTRAGVPQQVMHSSSYFPATSGFFCRSKTAPGIPYRAGSNLCWRKTASGMSVAWIGARQRQGWTPLGWRPLLIRIGKSELAGGSKRLIRTYTERCPNPPCSEGRGSQKRKQDFRKSIRIFKAPKSANELLERAFEFEKKHVVILCVCPPEWNAANANIGRCNCQNRTRRMPK